MEIRRLIDVSGVNADGTPFEGQMYETLHGTTKDTPIGVRWGVCDICLMSFPKNEMSLVRGKWYCRKNGCIKDTMPKERRK